MFYLYSVKLSQLIHEFSLQEIFSPQKPENLEISTAEVNRPGLNISGFYQCFQPARIQIIGKMETAYLNNMDVVLRKQRLNVLCQKKVPAIIVTSNNKIFDELILAVKKYEIPLLRTNDSTSSFMSDLIIVF